jgi:hypothetical protein
MVAKSSDFGVISDFRAGAGEASVVAAAPLDKVFTDTSGVMVSSWV